MRRLTPEQLLAEARHRAVDTSVEQTVRDILAAVRRDGAAAVLRYTEQFDKVTPRDLRVSPAAISAAANQLPTSQRDAIQAAANNIRRFAQAQRNSIQPFTVEQNGIQLGQTLVPIERIGAYVPGGRFPLVSTVLMNTIPAQIAGVSEIVVCSPPGPDGLPHPGVLAACGVLGISTVYAMGGAQAIAALAFGLPDANPPLKPVDKIVGPGNRYVAQAKALVGRECAIDFFAGPTEVLIVADDTAAPLTVAADLLSQAEHDVDARAWLATPSRHLIEDAEAHIRRELAQYPAGAPIHRAAEQIAVVEVDTIETAMALANALAPEHLQLQVQRVDRVAKLARHYGSLFLGAHSPVALGDYASGTNHTLPTQGAARAMGGLSVFHFLKVQTWQQAGPESLRQIAPTVEMLADMESLPAHKRSIQVRFMEKTRYDG